MADRLARPLNPSFPPAKHPDFKSGLDPCSEVASAKCFPYNPQLARRHGGQSGGFAPTFSFGREPWQTNRLQQGFRSWLNESQSTTVSSLCTPKWPAPITSRSFAFLLISRRV